MDDNINIEKTYNHWIVTSDKDFNTMIHLYDSKDYHWSLFIGHIVIERLMKACIVRKTGLHAPLTHDLTKLANLSGLQFTEEYLDWLDTITTFNINARYDSYKEAFYKKCTYDFTTEWIEKIKILQLWIKQKLLK
ncbi:MAG TPA: HEPN domain-containing protein [Bacteroidales bacterium]|nr:HEPN domain-containing protein [Bacteroidales bacterium]HQM70892.1 HEPN domain-containing protein [Bacteroidales bacterium]